MTTDNDEFVLSVVVRRRYDLDHPAETDEAITMVRGLLEQGSFLEVVSIVGRRRFTEIPEPTDDDAQPV